MNVLKENILKEGRVIEGNILKVDSFLNHQVDISLMNKIGKEFKERFKKDEVNKILTIEASGIAVASISAQYFDDAKVVFGRKTDSLNMDKETYSAMIHSYTKKVTYNVKVSKKYLTAEDKVIILDDFLAKGCGVLGLIDIVKQSGAKLIGVGIVIEKGWQKGRKRIEERGIRLESLAVIESMEENIIKFKEENNYEKNV